VLVDTEDTKGGYEEMTSLELHMSSDAVTVAFLFVIGVFIFYLFQRRDKK